MKSMVIKKQKNKIPKITINDLAGIIRNGFKAQEKITDDKIEDLAGMVKRGFDSTLKEINGVKDVLTNLL